ncbi:MAG TPA: GNAT family N-acetyltransferase [Candidatus Polarisedimenticolia bacterium]|jgi:CelD/BcsL family acetyltransferase involved in cellulose biosynthesis|nr:GNAT family N-acetyltransferase [Candidatus Polarisedimenticolia bacterium]
MLTPSSSLVAGRPLPCAIETIAEVEGFRRLRREWNELLSTSPSASVFLTWEWMFTWWKHLGGRRRLSILAVRSAGELVAIAPLAVRPPDYGRLAPFPSLEFLGTGFVGSDYLDLIVRTGREHVALPALADHLGRGKVMLEMAQVRTGFSQALDLSEWLEGSGWGVSASTTAVCPYIDLSGQTWGSYLAGLGPAHRANLQRRLRNLTRSSEPLFTEAASEEERREFLGHLIDLHNLRRRDLGGSEAFHTPGLLAFHQEFSALALQRGWLRLCLLRLDRKPAAALYGFRYGRTFYFYQSGFDPAYRKQSVGLVAMGLTIRKALEEGAAEFDLLHGDEGYKSLWARQHREIGRLEAYPPRTRGAIQRTVIDFGRGARRLARRAIPRVLADRIAAALNSRSRKTGTCLEIS